MSNCKVKFKSDIDGVVSNVTTFATLKKQNKNFSVTFFFDAEKSIEYTFSVIANKVTLKSNGMVSYSFTLEKGVKKSFAMDLLGGKTICEVNCINLLIKAEKKILVDAYYHLTVAGNIQKCKLSLEIEEVLC